ncbi:hypothetical protein FRC17_003939, partial [Serendipita sp. 399]
FHAERLAWRLVVLFNLVHSIRVLHSIVSHALQVQEQRQGAPSTSSPTSPFQVQPRSPIGLNDYPDLALRPSDSSLQRSIRSNNNNHNNGGLGEADQPYDQTDAASSYSSGAVSSSSASNLKKITFPGRRASLFSSSIAGSGNGNANPSRTPPTKGDQNLVTTVNSESSGKNATSDSGGHDSIGSGNAKETKQRKHSSRSAERPQYQQQRPSTSTGVAPSAVGVPGTNMAGSHRGSENASSVVVGSSPNLDKTFTRSPNQGHRQHPRRVASDELQSSVGWDSSLHGTQSRESRSRSSAHSSTHYHDGKAPLPPPMSPTKDKAGTFRTGAAPGPDGQWLHPHDGSSRTTSSQHPFRSIEPEATEGRAEGDVPVFTNHHQLLLMRLKPILSVEADLLKRLSMPDEDEPVRLDFNLTGMHQAAVNAVKNGSAKNSNSNTQVQQSTDIKSSPSSSSLSSSTSPSTLMQQKGTQGRTSHESENGQDGEKDRGGDRRPSTDSANKRLVETMAKKLRHPGRPRSRSSTDIVPIVTEDVGERQALYPKHAAASSSSLDKALSSSAQTMGASSSSPFAMGNVAAVGGVSVGHTMRRVSEGDADSSSIREGLFVPEFYVRSPNWKEKFWKWTRYDPAERWVNGGNSKKRSGEWDPWDDPSDPAHFIQTCARDLNELWSDAVVQEYLAKKRYKLEHSPGFFLGDVDRIVSRGYVPTDDDILRSRLKTIGVTEHQIRMNHSGSISRDWLVYDVGGTRTQRSAWVPYFDSADAIIFIANLAAFDQTLAEDPKMNRLEDSLRMFRGLVTSPILKNVNIVLFLNKIDLLEVKLKSGIKVSQYFGRFGDRANTVESVTKYFHAKFTAIYEKFTPNSSKRAFTIHQTSLTNARSTKIILEAVSQTIITAHLQKQVN